MGDASCETCRFFYQEEDVCDGDVGYCRRYAARPVQRLVTGKMGVCEGETHDWPLSASGGGAASTKGNRRAAPREMLRGLEAGCHVDFSSDGFLNLRHAVRVGVRIAKAGARRGCVFDDF
jgi:hypothetical protein